MTIKLFSSGVQQEAAIAGSSKMSGGDQADNDPTKCSEPRVRSPRRTNFFTHPDRKKFPDAKDGNIPTVEFLVAATDFLGIYGMLRWGMLP